MSSSKTATKPKRGPGRPPKKTAEDVEEIKGVISTPNDRYGKMGVGCYAKLTTKDIVKFLKMIGTNFKSFAVSTVQVSFGATSLSFIINSHSDDCQTEVVLDGNKLPEYYGDKPKTVSVNFKMLLDVSKSINSKTEALWIYYRDDQIVFDAKFKGGHTLKCPIQTTKLIETFVHGTENIRFTTKAMDFHKVLATANKPKGGKAEIATEWTGEKGRLLIMWNTENDVQGIHSSAKQDIDLWSNGHQTYIFNVKDLSNAVKTTMVTDVKISFSDTTIRVCGNDGAFTINTIIKL